MNAIFLAAALAPAHAAGADAEAPAFAWGWADGASRTYHLDGARYLHGEILRLQGARNLDARAVAFRSELVATCAAVDVGRRGADISCDLTDVALSASPYRQKDEAALLEILREWDEALTGARVELRFDARGNLRAVDLDGVSERNERERAVSESMRVELRTLFAGLDLRQLEAPLAVGATWSDPRSALAGLGGRLKHEVTALDGAAVTVQTRQGTTVEGVAVFDTARGEITHRAWHADQRVAVNDGPVNLYAGEITRADAATAGESRLWDPMDLDGAAAQLDALVAARF